MSEDAATQLAAQLIDPVTLAQDLIRCPSVTPADAGAMDTLQRALETLGFECRRYRFEDVDNLYARLGTRAPNFCFAGHTDVVPAGEEAEWSSPPFAARIENGAVWGRGAADMKGAIGAFVGAVSRFLADGGPPEGSISFLITGDEEGPAVNGTKKLLEAITFDGETIDVCLVGEPTGEAGVGDVIKNGRRGSLNGHVIVRGREGHVAYPERACNPVPVLLEFLARLMARPLDTGAPGFQPSNLEVTSIDVANPAHNVIPASAAGRFNVRFNTEHAGEQLAGWVHAERASVEMGFDGVIDVDVQVTGDAFATPEGEFTTLLQKAVERETGVTPRLSTGGGTSDARFIKDYAPVAELGLLGATIHKTDEHVDVADLELLARIYERVLRRYFSRPDA